MENFSPYSFTVLTLLNPLFWAAFASTIVSFLYALFTGRARFWIEFSATLKTCLVCSLPIGLLGYATGFLTGISRSPAIGTVVPAVLALVGGFAVYIFGSDSANRGPVAFSIAVLVIWLFYGVQSGGLEREIHRPDRLKALFEVESRMSHYRKNRGLPEKAPDWLSIDQASAK